MQIEAVVVGPIQTNCYLVEDQGELIVVDPGDDAARILEAVGERTIKELVVTHAHWDHISAVSEIQSKTGAPCAASAVDAPFICAELQEGHDICRGFGNPSVTHLLEDGDEVEVGSKSFKVIATPGHTLGSICLLCDEDHVLFAGDTLFAGGSYGRTDFPRSDPAAMQQTLAMLGQTLSDETFVLSGHGEPSRMDIEKKMNPYMR